MSINDILDIQMDALAQTVCEYTTDNYIRSYAKKLKEYKYPEDKAKLLFLLESLISWYELEIDKIKSSEYVHSKKAHVKSFELLLELKEKMNA